MEDDYTAGWLAAEEFHKTSDVTKHRSQGDTEFDKGWNAYIDYITLENK